MQKNFSSDAQRALQNAKSAAEELLHNHIGSEHLLLGLCLTEGSSAQSILEEAGVLFDAAKEKLLTLVKKGTSPIGDTIQMTPRAQRILQNAISESSKNHIETGTEFILLSLLSDGDCLGQRILSLLGADLSALYKACREIIGENVSKEHPSAKDKQKGAKENLKKL